MVPARAREKIGSHANAAAVAAAAVIKKFRLFIFCCMNLWF
jgi:hypothetical protein